MAAPKLNPRQKVGVALMTMGGDQNALSRVRRDALASIQQKARAGSAGRGPSYSASEEEEKKKKRRRRRAAVSPADEKMVGPSDEKIILPTEKKRA